MTGRLARVGRRVGVVALILATIPAACVLGVMAFLFLLSLAGRHL